MYSVAVQKSKGSIFPIIASALKNGKTTGRQVAGTGFFIDNKGHFVTALHVVSGNPNLVEYGSLGNVPYAKFKSAIPEKFTPIGAIAQLDLFVGRFEKTIQPSLKINSNNPPEGSSIIIGGYPFPNIKKSPNGGLNFFTVRQYWQSTMIMDYLNLAHFDPRLNYNGFLVDKRTIPGMSGGPALNLKGEVIGLCTAQITRSAKDKVANINGVCLDAKSLFGGIKTIFQQSKKV